MLGLGLQHIIGLERVTVLGRGEEPRLTAEGRLSRRTGGAGHDLLELVGVAAIRVGRVVVRHAVLIGVAVAALLDADLDGYRLTVEAVDDVLNGREATVGLLVPDGHEASGFEHTDEELLPEFAGFLAVALEGRVHDDGPDLAAVELTADERELAVDVAAPGVLGVLDATDVDDRLSGGLVRDEADGLACGVFAGEHDVLGFWVLFGFRLVVVGHVGRKAGNQRGVESLALADFPHEHTKVRGFDTFESAGAVLGGVSPFIILSADEGTLDAGVGLERLERDDLVEDAREFACRSRALNLGGVDVTTELVLLLVEDADEDSGTVRVLEVCQPADEFRLEGTIGGTLVQLAVLIGHGRRLRLSPLERQTAGHGDGVDVEVLVFGECGRITEGLVCTQTLVRLDAVRTAGVAWVRSGDEQGEGTAVFPRMDAEGGCLLANVDDVTGPVLDGKSASLEVDEQRVVRVERAGLRRLADAAGTEHDDVDFWDDLEAVVGLDDAFHVLCVDGKETRLTRRQGTRTWVRRYAPCVRPSVCQGGLFP